MGAYGLLSDVTRVQNSNVHQALHNELWLEEVLALLIESLHQQDSQHGAGATGHCPTLGHLPWTLPAQNSQIPEEPSSATPQSPPSPSPLQRSCPHLSAGGQPGTSPQAVGW